VIRPGYLVSGKFRMIDGRPCILVELVEPGAVEPGETVEVVEIPDGATVGMKTAAESAARRQQAP
jgi:predicted metalloenzyme YecM